MVAPDSKSGKDTSQRHLFVFLVGETPTAGIHKEQFGTWTQSNRVAAFATVLAQALKLDEEEVRAIACGALLHEIGKLAIPEASCESLLF
jgi:HD-GYP domain-containing protein (c-di-GMP phosphodiesterase class II)